MNLTFLAIFGSEFDESGTLVRTLQYILFKSIADFDLYFPPPLAEKRPEERLLKLFSTDLDLVLASFNG